MANDAFLKKIYDKYLDSDYTYGTSNLNPKREISIAESTDTDIMAKKIEEEIRRKFEDLKDETNKMFSYVAPKIEEPTIIEKQPIGSLTGGIEPKENQGMKDIKERIGGHLPIFPSIEEENPLLKEIDDLILKILPYAGVGVGEGAEEDEDTDPTLEEFNIPNINILNCHIDYKDLVDIKDEEDQKLENSGPIDANTCKNPTCPNKGKKFNINEMAFIAQHNGYCKECYENPENTKCPSCGNIIPVGQHKCPSCGNNNETHKNPNDTNTGTNANTSTNGKSDRDFPCVLRELSLLKIILVMVKMISAISRGISAVLAIAVPIIKVVSRCAGCWVCPPSAAEAVQLIMETVTSLLIDMAGTMMQMIWDMLQLDCADKIALDLKDQILAALAGISQLSHTGEDIKMVCDELAEETDKMVEEIEKANERTQKVLNDIKARNEKHKADNMSLEAPKQALKVAKLALRKAQKEGNAEKLETAENVYAEAQKVLLEAQKAIKDSNGPNAFEKGLESSKEKFKNFGSNIANSFTSKYGGIIDELKTGLEQTSTSFSTKTAKAAEELENVFDSGISIVP